YALVAVVGGGALAGVVGPVAVPLRWASAPVLLLLAARTAVGSVRRYRDPTPVARRGPAVLGARRAYLSLLAVTLLNPTTIVYFAALVLGSRLSAAVSPVDRAAFVLAAALASASWQLLLASGGALLGRLLAGERGRLVTGLCSSLVVAALAVHVLTST
ncbi:MAG: LysE family transporter, partial [Actinocatenispora sp.]